MIALGTLCVIVTVGACLVAYQASVRGLLAERMRRKVLVTLKSGEGFSGVLYATDRECLVLREAVAVAYGPRSENVPVGGEVVLLRADIAYVQLP